MYCDTQLLPGNFFAVAGRWTCADRSTRRTAPSCAQPVQDALYTAVRHLAASERIVERLAARAPAPDVAALLAVALAQLQRDRRAPHTVVDQAVVAAQQSSVQPECASGFVNALLRNFLRQRERCWPSCRLTRPCGTTCRAWWIERLRAEYPHDWTADCRVAATTAAAGTARQCTASYRK